MDQDAYGVGGNEMYGANGNQWKDKKLKDRR